MENAKKKNVLLAKMKNVLHAKKKKIIKKNVILAMKVIIFLIMTHIFVKNAQLKIAINAHLNSEKKYALNVPILLQKLKMMKDLLMIVIAQMEI